MIKDTESLDYMFVHTFGEETFDAETEFPFIAFDFLKHVYPDIEKYSQYVYADDSMDKWAPDKALRYKILNIILAAARHGDAYSREMLCRLYKVYYKREYNQLKRFRSISYDELLAFDNEEEVFEETAARILTICPFMGIEILPDCEQVLPDVKEILNDKTFEYIIEPETFTFDREMIEEAGEEARQLIKRLKKKGRDYYWGSDVFKFKQLVFQYCYLPDSFDAVCDKELDTMERSLTVTIGMLKKRFRNRTFSDEEIMLYHEIYQQIKSFTSQYWSLDETFDMMLGRKDKFEYELESCRYQPEKQKVITVAPDQKKKDRELPAKSPAKSQAGISTEQEEDYIREISDLKASLKQKQQNLIEARRIYLEAKEEAKQNRIDEELWEADRTELYRLREYVYSLAEEDVIPSSVSIKEMESELRDRKIIIVGGHDNWVGYLKERFPSWTYIKPSISNTLPEIHATNAEYLFFFTDTLSHGSFNKYMNVVKKHNLSYSYLHGTNIERTISSIYKEICKSSNR